DQLVSAGELAEPGLAGGEHHEPGVQVEGEDLAHLETAVLAGAGHQEHRGGERIVLAQLAMGGEMHHARSPQELLHLPLLPRPSTRSAPPAFPPAPPPRRAEAGRASSTRAASPLPRRGGGPPAQPRVPPAGGGFGGPRAFGAKFPKRARAGQRGGGDAWAEP